MFKDDMIFPPTWSAFVVLQTHYEVCSDHFQPNTSVGNQSCESCLNEFRNGQMWTEWTEHLTTTSMEPTPIHEEPDQYMSRTAYLRMSDVLAINQSVVTSCICCVELPGSLIDCQKLGDQCVLGHFQPQQPAENWLTNDRISCKTVGAVYVVFPAGSFSKKEHWKLKDVRNSPQQKKRISVYVILASGLCYGMGQWPLQLSKIRVHNHHHEMLHSRTATSWYLQEACISKSFK